MRERIAAWVVMFGLLTASAVSGVVIWRGTIVPIIKADSERQHGIKLAENGRVAVVTSGELDITVDVRTSATNEQGEMTDAPTCIAETRAGYLVVLPARSCARLHQYVLGVIKAEQEAQKKAKEAEEAKKKAEAAK